MNKCSRSIGLCVALYVPLMPTKAPALDSNTNRWGVAYLLSYGRGISEFSDSQETSSTTNLSLHAIISKNEPSILGGTGFLYSIELDRVGIPAAINTSTDRYGTNGVNLGLCGLTNSRIHICGGAGATLVSARRKDRGTYDMRFVPIATVVAPVRFGNGIAVSFRLSRIFDQDELGSTVFTYTAGIAWDVGTNSQSELFHRKSETISH